MAKQRISAGGLPFAIYVNETLRKQSIANGTYVNQTSPAQINVNLSAASTAANAASIIATKGGGHKLLTLVGVG